MKLFLSCNPPQILNLPLLLLPWSALKRKAKVWGEINEIASLLVSGPKQKLQEMQYRSPAHDDMYN